jgi:V-type H+-transporting ATPase subunit C
MPSPTKYILLSLPQRIFDTSPDDAISSLSSTIPSDSGTVLPFSVPSFKIGTLDALVGQADDLTKLDAACEGVVSKVADSLRSILDGDEDKLDQQKMVNDSEVILSQLVY